MLELKENTTDMRKIGVFMSEMEDESQVRSKLREAIEKSHTKTKGSKDKKDSGGCCPSAAWVDIKSMTMNPGKVVYSYDGQLYGRSWSRELTDNTIVLGKAEPVETVYVKPGYKSDVQEEEDEDDEDGY